MEQADASGENEATTTRIENLKKVLRVSEGSLQEAAAGAEPIRLLQLLADPDDPVQTIENFFDLSFLVKEKNVTIVQDRDGSLVVERACSAENKDADKSQKVLSLSMRALKDYLRSSKAAPDDRAPLHREDELYQAADAHEQAQLLDKRKSLSREKGAQEGEDARKKKQAKKG